MKKITVMVLILVFALSIIDSHAEFLRIEEDFSVRDGIKFGLSFSEIIDREKNSELTYNTMECPYSSTLLGECVLLLYDFDTLGGLSGISNENKTGSVEYFLSNNDELCAIVYEYLYNSSSESKIKSRKNHETLEKLLKEKYGEPLFYSGDTLYGNISTPAFDRNFNPTLGSYCQICGFAKWIVDFDDGTVIIDLQTSSMTVSGTTIYFTDVGYRYFSDTNEVKEIYEKDLEIEAADEKKNYNNF